MDNGSTAVLQRFNVRVGPGIKAGKAYPRDVTQQQQQSAEKKSSTQKNDLQGNESEEKRNLLKCGICREVFISIHDISNHLKHRHFQIQAFDCGVCMKFFPFHTELEAHLLDDHLQSDTGPAPILKAPHIDVGEIEAFIKNSDMRERVELQCPLCGCMYDKLAQYQDHMSASHRGKAWDKDGLCSAVLKVTTVKSTSVKPVIKDDPTEAVPGKVYSCDRCDQKVFGREPMKRHAATHHESEIIQCATCCEFFITHASYIEHKKKAHLTLLNLNVKQNKHGDIIGASLDDILKANDCLSKSCSDTESKVKPVETPLSKLDDAIYIDLDSKWTITHETVQVEPLKNTKKEDKSNPDLGTIPKIKEIVETSNLPMSGITRPDWKTHKRERSDDSLPDPDNPMYNLLLLSKSAVREQKRIAVESDGNEKEEMCGTAQQITAEQTTGQSESEFCVRKKLVCHEELLEKEGSDTGPHSEEYRARFFLSVFHAMTGLAAMAFWHLQKNIAV